MVNSLLRGLLLAQRTHKLLHLIVRWLQLLSELLHLYFQNSHTLVIHFFRSSHRIVTNHILTPQHNNTTSVNQSNKTTTLSDLVWTSFQLYYLNIYILFYYNIYIYYFVIIYIYYSYFIYIYIILLPFNIYIFI